MVLVTTWRLCLVSLKITRLFLIGYCLLGIISYSKSVLLVRTRFLQFLNIIRHNGMCSGGESVKRQPVPESEYYLLNDDTPAVEHGGSQNHNLLERIRNVKGKRNWR
jgi:hypothetical protein